MRKCKRCGRRQTNDPTALPKVVAAVNGYCLCWYDATEKLRQQVSDLRERAVAAMSLAYTTTELDERQLVDYMEQVAPVHLPCNQDGCALCVR